MNTKFVAEFTTNHMGNLNVLLRMVEQAAKAGCDLIKMQKKNVKAFYSREKLASSYKSPYGDTYEDYRTIFEFDDEDFYRFDQKCKECKVNWFSTVQDIDSMEFMLKFDLPAYKIASCNSRNIEFLEEVSRNVPRSKEMVISVAGCTLQEIEQSISLFPYHRLNILHCVAEYPCKEINLRLGNIPVLIDTFASDRIRIGYSGHEVGIVPTFAAADLGAKMIERHFCLSRCSFVHHIECSLNPAEFQKMTATIRSQALKPLYDYLLPPCAFRSEFGMSEREVPFLVEQTYGTQYLHEQVEIH
jgi:N-acetylneuraminate synthase